MKDSSISNLNLATNIAKSYMKRHSAELHPWDWGESVLMFSIIELYRLTQDHSFLNYAQDWIDFHLTQGYKIKCSDTCAPAITALELYNILNKPKYRKVVEDVLYYLKEQAPKTSEGGISHLGLVKPEQTSIWIDSLFMFGIVLSRWTETTGKGEYLDELGNQICIFSKKLQHSSGLYTHGWG